MLRLFCKKRVSTVDEVVESFTDSITALENIAEKSCKESASYLGRIVALELAITASEGEAKRANQISENLRKLIGEPTQDKK